MADSLDATADVMADAMADVIAANMRPSDDGPTSADKTPTPADNC